MKILTYPNPILTTKTKEIDIAKFGVKKLKKLARQMIKTMYQAEGVGLAAPQIGQSVQICVIRKKVIQQDEDLILINPMITAHSAETKKMGEGCLSLPGVQVEVERAKWIKIKAIDLAGEPFNLEATDLLARVLQHEIDHLNGILIINYE